MSVHTSDTGHNALKETLHRRKLQPDQHKHPVNVVHHEEATLGERLADAIASGIGSWGFLIIQTPPPIPPGPPNAIRPLNPSDPFPFILSNLPFPYPPPPPRPLPPPPRHPPA